MQQNKRNWLLWLLPTPGNVIATLLIISAVHWAQGADAIMLGVSSPITSTIPSEGFLTDSDGKPLSGEQSMTFSLYTEPDGGNVLWTEGRTGANSVVITDGKYNIMLGSVNPLDQRIIAENSTLYLGVTVGIYEEMRPRVQLGRVPYAVQALTVPDGSITRAKLASDVFEDQAGDSVENFVESTIDTSAKNFVLPFVDTSVETFVIPSVDTPVDTPVDTSVGTAIEHYIANAEQDIWDIPDCTLGEHGEDASWTAMPGLSIDFTLDISQTVWLDFAGLGMNLGVGQAIYSNIFVDGTRTKLTSGASDLSGCRNNTQGGISDSWCTLSNLAGPLLGPGDHTIEAKIWCDGDDGVARVYGGILRALVLP